MKRLKGRRRGRRYSGSARVESWVSERFVAARFTLAYGLLLFVLFVLWLLLVMSASLSVDERWRIPRNCVQVLFSKTESVGSIWCALHHL